MVGLMGVLLLAAILIRYAEPIKDGDLFFHLAYGKSIVESGKLIPDHTVYSWTDASGDHMYCAWIGQVLLHAVHQIGGFPLLFFLRYLGLFLVLGLIAVLYKQTRFPDPFLFLLMILVTAIGSYSGVFLKPEMFSMVFMAIMSYVYFQAKFQVYGQRSYPLLLLLPLLFLIWINTHGVWMFGMIILTILVAGEVVNLYAGSSTNRSPVLVRYLLIAYGITLPVLLINPFGIKYALNPVFRIIQVFVPASESAGNVAGVENIYAYGHIFKTFHDPNMHIITIWGIMVVLAVFAAAVHWKKQQRPDWALLLLNLALAILFARYMRANYYWGPFWCMSLMLWMSKEKQGFSFLGLPGRWGALLERAGISLVFMALSLLAIYKSIFTPYLNSWLGFGLNNWAPVDESRFLKEQSSGNRLFNSYKSGAYLIYDLFPDYKVFIDARRFPYDQVFSDYHAFQNGKIRLDAFLDKYPFDVALIDYDQRKVFLEFFNSKEWIPVFYGATGVIYQKIQLQQERELHDYPLSRFDRINNLVQANRVLTAALNFKGQSAAVYIFNRMKTRFKHIRGYAGIARQAKLKIEGLNAYNNHEYDMAYLLLSQSDDRTVVPVTQALLNLRIMRCRQFYVEKKYDQALGMVEDNLRVLPDHPNFLYAAGAIAYAAQARSSGYRAKAQTYMKQLLSKYPNHPRAALARDVLGNRPGMSLPLGL